MTDSEDFRALHDEPSRLLRVYPGRHGPQAAADFPCGLYEDDGLSPRHLAGDWAHLSFVLAQTESGLRLAIDATGQFKLPYRTGRVVLPVGETRPLAIESGAGLPVWTEDAR